jgi:hypothetical protein
MLQRQTDELNPADWFFFAKERLRAADAIWKVEGLTASGIEVLQEATERILKGYLIAMGWRLVKTHDLVQLVEEAARFNAAFTAFQNMAVELTADFFAQHYPGHDMTNVGSNYQSWRQDVDDLISTIATALPAYANDLK